MSRDELREASELLTEARDGTDDEALRERMAGLADQLEILAEASRGPDQGRIDRMENALNEVEAQLDGDPSRKVSDAHEKLREYRATVGGV